MRFAVNKTQYDIHVRVQFDLNGGTSISETEKTYVIGSTYKSFPSAIKLGYVQLGWFTDPILGRKISVDDAVDYSITTLYAKYTEMTNFTSFEVTTTSSYTKFGIYSTLLKSGSSSQYVDWGDGTTEEVTGNISQKVHTYSSPGTYVVKVSDDISSIAVSTNNSTWYNTTSQNRYTLKKILTYSTSVTSVPAYAYYYCYSLTSIVGIGNSNITSLPTYCFYYCYSLSSLSGLSKITSIGTYCFYYCYNLTSFTGIGNITSLPNYSFNNCYCITSLATLPSTVASYGQQCLARTRVSDLSRVRSTDTLGSYCFYGMNSLTSIVTLTPRSSLPAYCFYDCTGMRTLNFSSWTSLTAIPNYCFYNNRSLTSVTFNSSLKSIGNYAFYSCYASNFKDLNLKDTQLTGIGSQAFNYSYSLTSISLPSTLTNIGDYAFAGCRNVQQISSYAENAPTTYSNTFGCAAGTGTNSYVGNAYKSTGNNQLHVNNLNSYSTSYWQSILLDSSKCGFNTIPFDEYDIRGCKTSGLSSRYEYTGEPIVPSITVEKCDGTPLVKDTDYSMQLSNNIDVGTASLSITGINDYHGSIAKTFAIYDSRSETIEVDLNGQWRVAATKSNPDPEQYYLYESDSNYHVANAFAKMYVRTNNVLSLDLYIGSYAESTYDYTVIFDPDVDITSNPSYSTSGAKANTSGFQKSGNVISGDFKKVSYSLDGESHYITTCYRKDGSTDSGSDRGYLLVPKSKGPYRRLKYLRSDGNQWIDTGVKFTDSGRWTGKITTYDGDYRFIGRMSDTYTGSIAIATVKGANRYSTFYGIWNDTYEQLLQSCPRTVEIDFEFSQGKQSLSVDGVLHQSSTRTATLSETDTIYLFWTGYDFKNTNDIHYMDIYSGDQLVRSFVPAKDKSGVACMYDYVTNQYFYNQGIGHFAGPDDDLEYTELEYLQSDGYQWIDTRIPTSLSGRWSGKITSYQGGYRFIGNSTGHTTGSIVIGTSSTENRYPTFYGTWDDMYVQLLSDCPRTVSIDFEFKPGAQSLSVDGALHQQSTRSGNITEFGNILLFYAGFSYYGNNAIHNMDIYSGNVLSGSFIPVKDCTGTACMYDRVSKLFFYNKGSGSFIAGPEK